MNKNPFIINMSYQVFDNLADRSIENDAIIIENSLNVCKIFNNMINEYNKPHNMIDNITLKGFPNKFIYNYSTLIIMILTLFMMIPIVGIFSSIIACYYVRNNKKKYLETRRIVKKPWKNMIIVEKELVKFSFATFTRNNLYSFHDYIQPTANRWQLDEFFSKLDRELLERSIVTICSSYSKQVYKSLGRIKPFIYFVATIEILVHGFGFMIIYFSVV